MPEKEINVYLNDEKIGVLATDDDGLAEMIYDTSVLQPGYYNVEVVFEGDSRFERSSDMQLLDLSSSEQISTGNSGSEQELKNTIGDTMVAIADLEGYSTVEKSKNPVIETLLTCKSIPYKGKKFVSDVCHETKTIRNCIDDRNDTSCSVGSINYTTKCNTRIEWEDRVKKECRTKGYIIDNKIKISSSDYNCSASRSNGQITVICDSLHDGDGNGICSSGESCLKYEIDKTQITKFEKNSRNDFTRADDTFFKISPSAEVIR